MKLCLACKHTFESENWQCPSCSWGPETKDGFPVFARQLAEEGDGFPADTFAQLTQLEGKSFWFQARNELIIWALRGFFAHARRFFEIGCGTGFVSSAIKQNIPTLEVYGSDIFLEGLRVARQRLSDAHLLQMDARSIPFCNEFDVVGAFDVLEHIDDDTSVLEQMFQAVKPQGGVIVTAPQHPFLWSRVDDFSCHRRRYTRKNLLESVVKAGFELVRSTSFVSFLLPLMVLASIREKKSGLHEGIRAELQRGPLVNMMLGSVMLVERLFIKAGARFPAGGSLLVVAKKP